MIRQAKLYESRSVRRTVDPEQIRLQGCGRVGKEVAVNGLWVKRHGHRRFKDLSGANRIPLRSFEDLLGMFMQARDEDTGEQMTDGQLRDEVVTMLLAATRPPPPRWPGSGPCSTSTRPWPRSSTPSSTRCWAAARPP